MMTAMQIVTGAQEIEIWSYEEVLWAQPRIRPSE